MLPRVLVVDDQQPMLHLLVRILQKTYQVSTAERAKDAMLCLARQYYCAVVADLDMPDGDGIDVLRAAQLLQPNAKRILHTGCLDSALIAHKQSGLVDHILTKPSPPEEIQEVLTANSTRSGR